MTAAIANPLRIDGRPGGIRTHNIRFWRPALYQFELLACSEDHMARVPLSLRVSTPTAPNDAPPIEFLDGPCALDKRDRTS